MGLRKIPVLKRKEFIDEFQTTVKQEIALHEKKVQEADQRLNLFQKYIRRNKDLVDDKLKQVERQCLDLEKHFDEKNDIDEQFQNLKSNIKDVEKKNDLLNKNISILLILLEEYVKQDDFKHAKNSVQSQLYELKKDCKNIFSTVLCEKKQVEKRFSQEMESRKLSENEVYSSIDELRSTVESFKDKIDQNAYNSCWIIENRKKQNKIIYSLEKKFEYLDMKFKEFALKEEEKK